MKSSHSFLLHMTKTCNNTNHQTIHYKITYTKLCCQNNSIIAKPEEGLFSIPSTKWWMQVRLSIPPLYEGPYPQLDAASNKWEYRRPQRRSEHRSLSFYCVGHIMGSHINMQRVTNFHWSHYLLKYALKSEPLRMNVENWRRLGLQNVINMQLRIIASTTMAKPSLANEGPLACLQIPTVQKSIGIQYVDINLPNGRKSLKIVSRSKRIGVHAMDHYSGCPANMEIIMFHQYWDKYTIQKNKLKLKTIQGIDNYKLHYIYEATSFKVQYTDFSPPQTSKDFSILSSLNTSPSAKKTILF